MDEFKIISTLYESPTTVVYKAVDNHGKNLILKKLNLENPNEFVLSRFRREYRIADSFNGADYVVKAVDMDQIHGSPVIVMEDIGAEALSIHLHNLNLSLIEKIEISIKMTSAIEIVHNANTIHLDVNPSNFVWNPNNDVLQLIDFGLSSKSDNEIPEILDPGYIEGTIPYLAPEQSGRMNRPVDYRADLYSMGVSLYEMFTESLPFRSEDVLEMIHCHIAKSPPDPAKRNPEISGPLSGIILKLLHKSADLRYQSAAGLKADLCHGLKELKEHGRITYFDLAINDHASKFKLSQKLYARENETRRLLEAFERMCSEKTKLLVVKGVSGIGKSALAGELKKQLLAKKAVFISGKFDQLKEDIPFAALIQAVNSFIDQVLSETDRKIAIWKKRILDAVGKNGKVLTNLFKNIELIIGKQPDIADLDSKNAAIRNNIVFQNFIKAIACADNPLVLFIDDLQWSNKPSLDFLKLLLSGQNQHLLIIVAYRSEDVDDNHIVSYFMADLRKTQIAIDIIDLKPLDYLSTKEYICESLKRRDEVSEQLAKICFETTKGNPFFIGHLLISLQKEGIIYYSDGKWKINIDSITIKKEINNAIELMQRRILSISESAQNLLKLCSCIGDKFKLSTLSIITGQEKLLLYDDLEQLVEIGFILPSKDHKYFIDSNGSIDVQYGFLHDKIRQAAIYLIGDDVQKYHLKIGKSMLSMGHLNTHIFEIVNHLNKAIDLIEQSGERLELAKLNCMAGEISNKATAWTASYNYFCCGIGLLTDNSWNTSYDLTLRLYSNVCEAAYLNHLYDAVNAYFDLLVKNAHMLDRINAYEAKINSLIAQGKPRNAIEIGFEYLAELGYKYQQTPSKFIILLKLCLTIRRLKKINFDDLKIEAKLNDKASLAAIRVFMLLAPSLYVTRSANFIYVIITLINLFLNKGYHAFASYGIVAFAGVLTGKLKEYDLSYRLAKTAMNMTEHESGAPLSAKITYLASAFILPWRVRYASLVKNLREKFKIGLDHGDLEYAAFCAYAYCYMSLLSGKKLDFVDKEMSHYAQKIKSQETIYNYLSIYHQTVKNIKNLTDRPTKLVGSVCNQEALETYFLQYQNDIGRFELQSNRFYLCYLFGDINAADEIYESFLGPFLPAALSKHNVPIVLFYRALCLFEHFKAKMKLHRKELKEFNVILKQYSKWSRKNPANFKSKYLILSGASALIKGDVGVYLRLMNESVIISGELGYLNDKALAYELLSSYYLGVSNKELTKLYLEYAYNAYENWGAHTKSRALINSHRGILRSDDKPAISISKPTIYTSTGNSLNTVDLYSVVKASQVISGEIDLNRLLDKMLRIVVENASAQKGILLLKEGDDFSVKGFYDIRKEHFETNGSGAIIPKSVINYVAHTSGCVICDNAIEDSRFNKDETIIDAKIKSILCLPLKLNNRILGIIYLDNNSVEKAFTKNHFETISLLSVQAAISIENAMLFRSKNELDELRIAKKMAEAETKAKRSFIAHMSHDIRTPLNTILGYSELLNDNLSHSSELSRYTKIIKSSSMLLLSLINKILELTRIENGKVNTHREYISLVALVNAVRTQIEEKIKKKGLAFDIRIDEFFKESMIEIDELHLKQILLNLLDNAYKYTEKGYIKLSAVKHHAVGNKLEMSLIVEDSGVGIMDTEKIFEEFEQLQPFSDKWIDGAGLGLSIVKKLVSLMRGKIIINSLKNNGTRIEIKFSRVDSKMNSGKPEKIEKTALMNVSFENKNVLVADDNANNRELIIEYLRPHGINIIEARNGQESVDAFDRNIIHLVILDMKMPIMDGFEAAIIIKEKSITGKVPIIALTADTSKTAKDRALECGCEAFLLKPVSKKTILNALMGFLDHTITKHPENIETVAESEGGIDCDFEKRDDIIYELKRLKHDKWEAISQTMILSQIGRFAADIEGIGKKYNSSSIEAWGTALRTNANHFDKSKVQLMMRQYPKLIPKSAAKA
jgi:predicted ATPase/signal transduction histidine kinase/CheY-like chemotaxis protein/tRNA A-37 threonylcarbamoyl transferase component Bud32